MRHLPLHIYGPTMSMRLLITWSSRIRRENVGSHGIVFKSLRFGPSKLVQLQFPYELSFLSVFWISSKSNQKYMLDVVNEVFSRSGSTKTRHREASWRSNSFILGPACLYIGYQNTTGSPKNDQIR